MVAADYGQEVPADRVLGRPAVGALDDLPMVAREALELAIALRSCVSSPGRVTLAASQQELAMRAHRARGLAGRDRHPLRRRPSDAGRDAEGAAWFQSREKEGTVEQRIVRCHDDLLGGHRTAVGAHATRLSRIDLERRGTLKYRRSAAVDCSGEPLHVADRVQLKLVVEADRAVGRVGQLRLVY